MVLGSPASLLLSETSTGPVPLGRTEKNGSGQVASGSFPLMAPFTSMVPLPGWDLRCMHEMYAG